MGVGAGVNIGIHHSKPMLRKGTPWPNLAFEPTLILLKKPGFLRAKCKNAVLIYSEILATKIVPKL